jgi:hypothetical protein
MRNWQKVKISVTRFGQMDLCETVEIEVEFFEVDGNVGDFWDVVLCEVKDTQVLELVGEFVDFSNALVNEGELLVVAEDELPVADEGRHPILKN